MPSKRGSASNAGSRRDITVRVKSARGRKSASTRWLQRQLNDPYVTEAKRAGYRSRAAFKLVELDKELGLLSKGDKVIDLGAAPGGWCQVALEVVGSKGRVVGVDLQAIEPIEGVTLLEGDITDPGVLEEVFEELGGKADLVMSDMAAPSTGHRQTDHLRVMGLVEIALDFAEQSLAPDGAFVAKVLQGGTENQLLNRLRLNFRKVKHIKPPASRQDSREMYVAGLGFKANEATQSKDTSGEDYAVSPGSAYDPFASDVKPS